MKHPAWFLLLAVIVALTFRIGGASDLYQNEDQTKTMSFTADMVLNHQFILPRDSEGIISKKPPLVNWIGTPIVALGFWNEWALKLPSLLATIITVILCFWMTRRMGNYAVSANPEKFSHTPNYPVWLGIAAGIAYLANPSTTKHIYFLRPDMLNVTCLTAAWILGTLTLEENTVHQKLKALGFWLCVGLAALTKGTTALIPILYIILAARLIHGRWSTINRTGWYWGFPLALAVFSIWILPAYFANPHYVTHTLMGEETAARMAEGTFFSWLITILSTSWELIGWFIERFFPWAVAALVGILSIRPRAWKTYPFAPAIIWTLLVMAFFIPLEHRGGSYIMPAYPAAAALAVYFLSAGWKRFSIPLTTQIAIGFLLIIVFYGHKSFFGEDAKKALGDRIKVFTSQANEIVKDNPVAFFNLQNNPVITLMHRHQAGDGSSEIWNSAQWIVSSCSAEDLELVTKRDHPLVVSEILKDPYDKGNDVYLCLFRNPKTGKETK